MDRVKTTHEITKELDVVYNTIRVINNMDYPFKKETIIEKVQTMLNTDKDVTKLVDEVIDFLLSCNHIGYRDGKYYVKDYGKDSYK